MALLMQALVRGEDQQSAQRSGDECRAERIDREANRANEDDCADILARFRGFFAKLHLSSLMVCDMRPGSSLLRLGR